MGRIRFCCLALVATVIGCEGQSPKESANPIPSAPALSSGSSLPKAPDVYRVKFETTKGDFVVEVHRDWSPNGADRFHELVQSKFYDGVKFFRAVDGFMVQFGISGDPAVSSQWRERMIPDDPVVKSNTRGFITFAKPGFPDSRTTQVFINYANNANLDGMGFSPFGEVVEGMDVVDSLHKEYGEEPSRFQQQIQEQGNAFLEEAFPKLDAVKTARIMDESGQPPAN